jgi:PAS domain S-box-containing protein
MSPQEQKQASIVALRTRAENKLRHRKENLQGMSTEELKGVVHELRVHQVELQMQNEQLRATQAELEQARERYVELFDFAPVGYLTLNKHGIIVQANLTCVGMLGTERSRLLSTPFSRFVVSVDQEAYYLCWRKVFESHGRQFCDVRLQPSAGEPFYARLEAIEAMEDGEGVCRLTVSDIREQKGAEESLRESERQRAKYESEEWKQLAFEAGELGAWDHDLQTGRISCSGQACTMLGYPPGASLDLGSIVSRVHPEDREGFSREMEKSANPGGRRRCEAVFRVVPPGGGVRWLRLVARSFFSDGPSPSILRRTGVLVDITSQREARELLESRAKHLDALVSERTMRLREAVSELEHFSYTLAHDLRAPLRSISGYGSLLLERNNSLSPADRHFLERSGRAVSRMDQLITDALNYNKIVRENHALQPVDCAVLLNELMESYPQFQEARASISIEDRLPIVLGNPALLTQCFSNLLANALKFVPEGRSPRVHISAQERGNRVRILFRDNGIGIAEESQEKVFKMFQRLNACYEGTGIGLALVKKAVERMHGSVGLQSHGQGCCFWLDLTKP